MHARTQLHSLGPSDLKWHLIFITLGIFIAYIASTSSERLRYAYSTNPRYPSEMQRQPQPSENQYQNRYHQGQGQGFNNLNNNNNNNMNNNRRGFNQGVVQQQYPQRDLNMRGGPNSRQHNTTLDQNQNKCRLWVPVEFVDKYRYPVKHEISNGLQMIEICCKGYEPMRLRGHTYCRPSCDNCQNGICIAPNECQCHEEFVKNDNDDCVFTCPIACLNGKCYLDGTCECDPGYKLDETRKFCRPICSAGCVDNERYNCTEPEVCGCSKGYRLTENGCEPTCNPDCGIGGTCVAADVCECSNGTELKDNVCQDNCYQLCDNGVCYERNRCICNPGFTYHEHSTQCVPV